MKLSDKKLFSRKTFSMRTRIWFFCCTFGAILLAMVWLFQIVLLNYFHFNYQVDTIHEVVAWVESNYSQLDSNTFGQLARELSSENDVYINIMTNPSTFSFAANPVGRSYGPDMDSSQTQHNAWYFDSPLPTVYLSSFYQAVKYSDQPYLTARVKVISSYPMLLYGERILNEAGDQNVLVVSAPLYPLSVTVRILTRQMIVISFIAILMTIGISIWMSWYVSAPFRRLNQTAKQLATPEFNDQYRENAFTEAQELGTTLVATNVRLNQTEKLRNELIANLSHDLRTPITMIRLYAEMIHDFDQDQEEDRKNQTEIIMEECDRLSELVQLVLDYSKMKAGVVPYNPEVFDILQTVESVMKRYLPLDTEEYQLSSLIDESCNVWGESKAIENVLFNLINNAIHHSEGKVHISILCEEMDQHVRIHVKDDGPGITDEQMESLWVRYYSAKTTRKTAKTKNIGLGLSIVAATMNLHHMPFGVDSKPGEGADFWFELEKIKK